MELEMNNENGILTIKVIGKLDTITAPKLEEEISKNDAGVKEIILNFEDLKYISSSGLRVLLATRKKYNNMKILRPIEDVMEVFEITGLTDVFNIKE